MGSPELDPGEQDAHVGDLGLVQVEEGVHTGSGNVRLPRSLQVSRVRSGPPPPATTEQRSVRWSVSVLGTHAHDGGRSSATRASQAVGRDQVRDGIDDGVGAANRCRCGGACDQRNTSADRRACHPGSRLTVPGRRGVPAFDRPCGAGAPCRTMHRPCVSFWLRRHRLVASRLPFAGQLPSPAVASRDRSRDRSRWCCGRTRG